jgi:hypothetical protein
MPAGSPIALTTVRVLRGQDRPAEDTFRRALERDRASLGLPPSNGQLEYTVAGPYPIVVKDQELDEYVVWER